jgi:hypothetical protein
MLIVTKRRYTRKHVIGGAGILDTITGAFKRLFTSGVANRAASTALSMGKDVAKEFGKKALDVGQATAVEVGKRLIDKTAAKLLASPVLAPPAQKVLPASTPLTRENAAILARLIPTSSAETNINNILAGDGLGSSNAVSIRDLVRHLNNNKNGAGLKLA